MKPEKRKWLPLDGDGHWWRLVPRSVSDAFRSDGVVQAAIMRDASRTIRAWKWKGWRLTGEKVFSTWDEAKAWAEHVDLPPVRNVTEVRYDTEGLALCTHPEFEGPGNAMDWESFRLLLDINGERYRSFIDSGVRSRLYHKLKGAYPLEDGGYEMTGLCHT